MVNVQKLGAHEYVNERHVDILGTDRFSDRTIQALTVASLTPDNCMKDFARCSVTVANSDGLNDEQRLSALAELWLDAGLKFERQQTQGNVTDSTIDAFLQSAHYAYAYLFFTPRTPADRVFDLRQTQIMDFYNFAVQRVISGLYREVPHRDAHWTTATVASRSIARGLTDVSTLLDIEEARELLPATELRFGGLRNVYTRDGFGSDFVAVAPLTPMMKEIAWREPEYASMTGALVFGGATLTEVLATHNVALTIEDPYREATIKIAGGDIPLSANFTAAYGLWLARSGFASQSIRSLLAGRGESRRRACFSCSLSIKTDTSW